MIGPELRRRIRKVENLLAKTEKVVSDEQKKRAARAEAREASLRPLARRHATAVAAIALFGNAQINEPLIDAWRRALRFLKDQHGDEFGDDYVSRRANCANGFEADGKDWRYGEACRKLYPIIIEGANERDRFAEIFAAAPIWLMNFTDMAIDEYFLKFRCPRCATERWYWTPRNFGRTFHSEKATDDDFGPEIAL
jgi:hypothetical protein